MTAKQAVLGIVAALPGEARCLAGKRPRPGTGQPTGDGVLLHVSGMGTANAAAAAKKLVNSSISALVSWGFCGALAPELQPGDIVLPETVMDAQDDARLAVDAGWHERVYDGLAADGSLTIRTGTLLTCTAAIQTPDEKQRLHQASGAVAADMESAAVAAAAGQAGLPFIAIRSVTDAADMTLPSTALAMVDANGRLQLLYGLGQWLRHPGQTPALLGLARGTRNARRALGAVATRTGPRLLAPAMVIAEVKTQVSCPD